jgi:MFS family permease
LLEVSLQVGMFVAGAASGFVYKYAGFAATMFVTAAMYGVGAGAIKLVRVVAAPAAAARPSYVTMLSQGFRFLRSHPATFVIGVVSIVPLVVTMLFNVVLPGYVSRDLGGDSVVFGFGDMSYGVGGLIAGLTVAWIAARLSPKRLILAFFGLSAAVLGLLGWNSLVVGLYIGCVGLGLANSAIRILMNSLIMERVPEEYMGRAMTVWLGISLGLQCLFSIFFSSYLDRAGAGVGFALMAALMVVGLIGFIVVNRVDPRNTQTAE